MPRVCRYTRCGLLLLVAGLAAGRVSAQRYSLDGKLLPIESGRDSTSSNDAFVAGRPIARLTDVKVPSLTLSRAPGPRPAPVVLICPGGGYQVLASDLEGSEAAAWLNSLGLSALVLHYRVPTAKPHREALEDAQAALAVLQKNADAWHLDASRIALLGFSAGADLVARLAHTLPSRKPVRGMLLVYPAYLSLWPTEDGRCGERVRADVEPPSAALPVFLVQAQDDPIGVCNSVDMAAAARQVGAPAELHLYAAGGHGYGLRRTVEPVTEWTDLAAAWLRRSGFTAPAH